MKTDTVKTFDDLPKFIEYDTIGKTFYFHPIIIKIENKGLYNSYYAMYARLYQQANINPKQVLFFVTAGTLSEVKNKFIKEYNKQRDCIHNKKWIGEAPQIINLEDARVYRYLKAKNINWEKFRLAQLEKKE